MLVFKWPLTQMLSAWKAPGEGGTSIRKAALAQNNRRCVRFS
jgi:hypothetical protein